MVTLVEEADLAVSFKGASLVDASVSSKAEIALWSHPLVGHILTINGEVQHVEKWQSLYHEPLVHLPATFVPEINSVLILGGGSLFAAAQALLYSSVMSVTLVDHDPEVLKLVGRHYEHARHVLADSRFNYVNSNVTDYLQNSRERFDLVINDGFDLIAASESLPLHQLMSSLCSVAGACADVTYRHLFDVPHQTNTLKNLAKLGHYALSLVIVPEYPGTLHLLTVWGNDGISQKIRAPINKEQQLWSAKLPQTIQYYAPEFLPYYFYLPPYVRAQMDH